MPFNTIKVGERIIGLDAFFWPSLRQRHAVVLLAIPSTQLSNNPGHSVLPVRVSVYEQLEDLRSIASMEPQIPGRGRLFGLRLLSLIVPGRFLHDAAAERFVRYADQRMARDIARHLSRGEPMDMVLWLDVVFGKGRVDCSSELADRNYNFLARVDSGFSSELRLLCRSM